MNTDLPTPRDRTTRHPSWTRLPEPLRDAISTRLGSPVTDAQPRGDTSDSGFAYLVATAGRGSYFIKATPTHSPAADRYRTEARISAALPRAVPTPRLLWSDELAGHVVLCFIAVVGRTPPTPWQADELRAALRAQAAIAATLTDPPTLLRHLATKPFSETAAERNGNWAALAAGRRPAPGLPAWALEQLPVLADLEAMLPDLTADPTSLIHGDLHPGNLIILNRYNWTLATGWGRAQRGPSWIDTVTLLIDGSTERTATERLLAEHPTAGQIPPRGVEALLAAHAGQLLIRAASGPDRASPHLRSHRRRSGLAALEWLRRRLQQRHSSPGTPGARPSRPEAPTAGRGIRDNHERSPHERAARD